MTEPFLGEIRMFPYNFAPRGWATCDGQILSIAQNTALFALLGTTYGGNGQTTYALPDLRGRIAVGTGQGPGLSQYDLGQQGGSETVTLLSSEMPSHNHVAFGASATGASRDPRGRTWAPSTASRFGEGVAGAMDGAALASAGGGQPHTNVPPYLTILFCIAVEGTFPARN